jgi:phage N-6-adenine-methyltransferase
MKFRPEADIFPLMQEEDLITLAEDIDKNGQLLPILLYEGDILDGRNRWLAINKHCKKNIKPVTAIANTDSPIAFVVSHNEKRRHMSKSQLGLAAAKALPFYEEEAAKRKTGRPKGGGESVGKSAHTSERKEPLRASDEAGRAFHVSGKQTGQGKRVLTHGHKALHDAVESDKLSLDKAVEIIKQYPDKNKQAAAVARIAKSKMVTRVKGLTGEIEWYTPTQFIEAARTVMGSIDLDPASSCFAQERVKAENYFTLEDDGLTQKWFGNVFLNPPYAMPSIKQFVFKIVDSYKTHEIKSGVLLTNSATDTEWFHYALAAASAVCLTRGRISFIEAKDGEMIQKTAPTNGQAFFYFGKESEKFKQVFEAFGAIIKKA